jgi:hypothetical protein
VTNYTKYYTETNDTHLNIYTKIKICPKNNIDRGINAQSHNIHKTEKNTHTQIINNKNITNDTKCHLKISVTFINKNIKIKINKNNIEMGLHMQAHNTHKTKNNKYIKIKNEKIKINDTNCHFKINITGINKNKKIKINENNNSEGTCA